MGEYADMAIDDTIDSWGWVFDDFRPARRRPRLTRKVCRHCGESNLIWIETDTGWRLHKIIGNPPGAVLHVCDTSIKKLYQKFNKEYKS